MAGARLIMERLMKELKFQRPGWSAGPLLVRLMLASLSLMDAITKRPPISDQMLGTISMLPGSCT